MTADYQKMEYIGLIDIPLVEVKDDIAEIILYNARRHNLKIFANDIIIITQKIISKSESRLRDLRSVEPSRKAIGIAKKAGKDPRLVQLILNESEEVMRVRKGLIITRHKNGFVCANAGIDHSNTVQGDIEQNMVLLLPEDADRSARLIRDKIQEQTGKKVGVIIIDSHGRAWRNGTIGTTIGIAGVPGVVDLRGQEDLFGYKLRATFVAAADELAAGASLLMGQANEQIPVVIARGFPYPLRESSLNELIRLKKNDLFQ